jgi:hypothetical protein
MKRKHFLIIGGVIFAVLLLLIVLSLAIPRSARTQWYTTVPLDTEGTRIKIQIPVGWIETNAVFENHGKELEAVFDVLEDSTPLSSLLDNFRAEHERRSSIMLTVTRIETMSTLTKECSLSEKYHDPNGYYIDSMIARRTLHFRQAGYSVELSYIDNDLAKFERDQHIIMDNITVVP